METRDMSRCWREENPRGGPAINKCGAASPKSASHWPVGSKLASDWLMPGSVNLAGNKTK